MGTSQVTVKHWTLDGRNFIVRYGELDPKSIKVKEKEIITSKKEIGKTGFLQNKDGSAFLIRDKTVVYMLHFELYSGDLGFNLKKEPLTTSSGKYLRRGDLLDPIDLLKEGYENSFETNNENKKDKFFTIDDATKALKKVYLLYGRKMAQTIESMYRWECSHFKSIQYKNCGAPGMEVSGNATSPNYGWDGTLYIKYPEYSPIGTWESFENKGMKV